MQLTVKTLKGEKFVVNAEPSNTVAEVKAIIETEKSELPAANMKLIHSGKVLKDADSIESCNIKPNAFLVVMITKAKKAAAPPPATPAATTPAPATPAAASSSTPVAPTKSTDASSATAAASETTATPAPTTTTTSTPSATAASTATAAPTSTSTSTTTTTTTTPATDEFPAEMVANLTAMGFPDAEVRACLRASQGNPDVAVEFLMNGIPPGIEALQGGGGAAGTSTSTTATTGGEPLAQLRSHPQINQLRQLVQSNPQSLQAVLTQIGQQQPSLLQEINSNQELFLQIMNEPASSTPATATSSSSSSTSTTSSSTSSTTNPPSAAATAAAGFGSAESGQAQALAQMIQGMSPEQMNSMASMYGITPEQLQMTAQMIGQLPPEQLQQYMNMALSSAGGGAAGGDLSGLMGAMGGAGGVPGAGGAGGPQVLELNAEEIAAVNRLADMGFDRSEAAQAYIACDKNEALAANLLMDGGFGFQDDMGAGAGAGGAPGNGGADGSGGSGDDNMYD